MFFGKEQQTRGNARTKAVSHMQGIGKVQAADECAAFGRALHYMTDMTMPMHATGFSGGAIPLMLHPVFESYVPFVQGRFVPAATTRGDQQGRGLSADAYFEQASPPAVRWHRG